MKSWYKSKTIIVAILTVALAAVQAAQPFIPAEQLPLVVGVIGGINFLLRFVTEGKIGK